MSNGKREFFQDFEELPQLWSFGRNKSENFCMRFYSMNFLSFLTKKISEHIDFDHCQLLRIYDSAIVLTTYLLIISNLNIDK